jgi:hypothetical protein
MLHCIFALQHISWELQHCAVDNWRLSDQHKCFIEACPSPSHWYAASNGSMWQSNLRGKGYYSVTKICCTLNDFGACKWWFKLMNKICSCEKFLHVERRPAAKRPIIWTESHETVWFPMSSLKGKIYKFHFSQKYVSLHLLSKDDTKWHIDCSIFTHKNQEGIKWAWKKMWKPDTCGLLARQLLIEEHYLVPAKAAPP